MSKRETIVEDMVLALKNADNPMFGLVTRDLFDPEQLSRQQFPAIYVATANETKNDLTMTGNTGTRESFLEISLVAFVNGTNVDTLRNEIIERIEEVLDADRSRDGNAIWTQIKNVEVDFEVVEPFGRVDILAEIYYTYTRGRV